MNIDFNNLSLLHIPDNMRATDKLFIRNGTLIKYLVII